MRKGSSLAQSSLNANWWWWLTSVALLIFAITRQYHWLISGEMWAEMGTNYFVHAHRANWPDWLLATDAGYLPIPQRLLASLVEASSTPIAWTPYAYNALAIVLASLSIGAFAHPWFRPLASQDALRAGMCLLWGIVLDFETRTFINFTYTFALLGTLCCARVIVKPGERVPGWLWLLPILLLSKPAVLLAYVMVLIAAWYSRGSMRAIATACTLAVLLQIWTLAASRAAGIMPSQAAHLGIGDLIRTPLGYSIGYLGAVVVGQDLYLRLANLPVVAHLLPGTLFLCGSAMAFWRTSSMQARALMLAGGVLLLGNMVLNVVALGAEWDHKLTKLNHLWLYRHVVVAFWGATLIVLGTWLACCNNTVRASGIRRWSQRLLSCWLLLVAASWLAIGFRATKPPSSPILGNGQWQAQARYMQHAASPLCVPVDPFAWGIYGDGCIRLNKESVLRGPWSYITVTDLDIKVPTSVRDREILALSIIIAAPTPQSPQTARAQLIERDGTPVSDVFEGHAPLTIEGHALTLRTASSFRARTSIRLHFDTAVRVLQMPDDSTNIATATMWMGKPYPGESERDR
ncbi:hypothetical protein [Aquabacterium sp.]|uniref:hypothetical protein n=1 Tax=Aquabacterium sp. TaxID=1872578 RepID=UPI0035B3FF84